MTVVVKHFIKGGDTREDVFYGVNSVTHKDSKTYITCGTIWSFTTYKTNDICCITDSKGRVLFFNKVD